MKKSVFIIFAALFVCGFFAAASFGAQTETPEALYARGVYLFFNGRYDEAESCFRRGTELSSENPANFYYLGLTQLRSGREEQARESFKKGAEAEWSPRGRLVDVPGHLIRIQGNERLLIEEVRRDVAKDRREEAQRLSDALFGSEVQQQRRRLAAALASGQTVSSAVPAADGLPSVPPIQPLFSPEVNGYLSEELAQADREGFINLQKDERLDEDGNIVKLDYLSTEAKRRAEKRRTIAEERRLAKENFVDIFDTENTASDNTTFDGGTAAGPAGTDAEPRTEARDDAGEEPAPFFDDVEEDQ